MNLKPYMYSDINPLRYSPKIIKERQAFRCEHRHSGMTHPKCFEKANDINERIGCLDIEAGGLKANFDIMLSWAIKTSEKDEYLYDHLTKADLASGNLDARIVETLVDSLWKYDRVVTHYGNNARFDVPFIRTRYLWLKARKLLSKDCEFPPYGYLWQSDTFTMSKQKLCLHSRRQDAVAKAILGKNVKTYLDPDKWMMIRYGTTQQRKDAIDYIVEHNIRDTEQLDGNFLTLSKYVRTVRTSI